jgi:kynureninase
MSLTVGGEIAPLIGAAPGTVAMGDSRGFPSATPREIKRRGGTFAVDFDNPLEVSRELNARNVLVDYRPGVGIRLSPHFYTDDVELDRAFDVMDEVGECGAWRRWGGAPAIVA